MKCVPHEMCRRLACGTLILEAGKFYFIRAKPVFHDFESFHVREHISFGREKTMSENLVLDLSMDFAISVVKLCEALKGKCSLTNQLLRSGTSIGANIHEANYASSKADFIAKMQIALKECHETEFWLKLFVKTDFINEETYKRMSGDSGKIRRILIASLNTAKDNTCK